MHNRVRRNLSPSLRDFSLEGPALSVRDFRWRDWLRRSVVFARRIRCPSAVTDQPLKKTGSFCCAFWFRSRAPLRFFGPTEPIPPGAFRDCCIGGTGSVGPCFSAGLWFPLWRKCTLLADSSDGQSPSLQVHSGYALRDSVVLPRLFLELTVPVAKPIQKPACPD